MMLFRAAVVEVVAIAVAFVSAAGGHGNYVAAKILFPYSLALTHFTHVITRPLVALALRSIRRTRSRSWESVLGGSLGFDGSCWSSCMVPRSWQHSSLRTALSRRRGGRLRAGGSAVIRFGVDNRLGLNRFASFTRCCRRSRRPLVLPLKTA